MAWVRRVRWRCTVDQRHVWSALISNRTRLNSTGCPKCRPKSSKLELRIFCEIKTIFKDVEHRSKYFGRECDIFIPSIKVGIEVSGGYWHRNRFKHDKEKDRTYKQNGFTIIHVREKGLARLNNNDIEFHPKSSYLQVVHEVLRRIMRTSARSIDAYIKTKIIGYIFANSFANSNEFNSVSIFRTLPGKGKSLYERYPRLANQWHKQRNGALSPKMFTAGSNEKIWWKCDRCSHEWTSVVSNRVLGNGCPACGGKVATKNNCFATMYPKLSQEWHPTKNGSLLPMDVTPGQKVKIYWLCPNCNHTYNTEVYNRTYGGGCPSCAGKVVTKYNSLAVVDPKLASELHPRNMVLAYQVTSDSNRMADWLCPRCGHEWTAKICSRRSGYKNCFHCRSLQFLNPKLASQWDKEANDRSPADVTSGSAYKAIWKCSEGHRWRARVASRNEGNGCGVCNNRSTKVISV